MISRLLWFLSLTEVLASTVPAIRTGIKPKPRARTTPQSFGNGHASHSCCNDAPKVFIVSMFTPEADIWYHKPDFNLLAKNITIPGLSPLFPQVHCTSNGEVCQVTIGEGQNNAAASVMALWMSNCFDLSSTYFLIAGIGGVDPNLATTGSVTFARYAIQFDLQYAIAQSQIPGNDSSGYFPLGTDYADEYSARDYPVDIYGTEVFELNDNLKKRAVGLARHAKLNDTAEAQAYRSKYPFAPANLPPAVVECDSGTTNVYWCGSVLGNAFAAYTKLLTNGSGTYCNSQQEDNATLEAMLRGAIAKKLDFSRIIIMRTASDFERAPPDETETFHLLQAEQGGFAPGVENIYIAGIEIVKDVLQSWDKVYLPGVKATNYVGDIFDSLHSKIKPDIGVAQANK